MIKPTQRHYRSAAKRMFHAEGRIEVDDKARLAYAGPLNESHKEGADDGAYVAAWVWVPREEASKEI